MRPRQDPRSLLALAVLLKQHGRDQGDGNCTCGHPSATPEAHEMHQAWMILQRGWRVPASFDGPALNPRPEVCPTCHEVRCDADCALAIHMGWPRELDQDADERAEVAAQFSGGQPWTPENAPTWHIEDSEPGHSTCNHGENYCRWVPSDHQCGRTILTPFGAHEWCRLLDGHDGPCVGGGR